MWTSLTAALAKRLRPFLFVTIGLSVGCGTLYHHREDMIVQREAKHEFDLYAVNQPKGKHARHFERGWRQGYYDVSIAGKSCAPTLPPQPYWSAKYKTAQGAALTSQWYDGYHQGAEYARHCGMKPVLPWQTQGCVEPQFDACSTQDGDCGANSRSNGAFDAYNRVEATSILPRNGRELVSDDPLVDAVLFENESIGNVPKASPVTSTDVQLGSPIIP